MATLLQQAKLRYKKVRSSLTSGSDSSAPVSADSTPFSSPTKLTPADSALTSVGQGNASSPRRLNRVPSIQTALGATASLIAETASSGDNLPEKEDERVAEEGGEQRQRRLSAQRSEERKMQAAVEKAEEIVARELEKERASAERRDASRAKFLDLERREREQAEVKSQRQRAQQRIDELKARAEDATKRAEMAWKMREARTASDSFCAIFPDKDKVASDALLYASNAASSLSSSLRSRGGLSLLLASAASSLSSSAASGLGSFLEPGKAGGVALLDAANSAIASKVNDGTVDWIYQSAPARLIRKQVLPAAVYSCKALGSVLAGATSAAEKAFEAVVYVPRLIFSAWFGIFVAPPLSLATRLVRGREGVLVKAKHS